MHGIIFTYKDTFIEQETSTQCLSKYILLSFIYIKEYNQGHGVAILSSTIYEKLLKLK